MRLSQRLVLKYVRTKFRLLSSVSKKKAAQKAFILFCTPQYRNRKKFPPVFEKAEKLRFPFEGATVEGYRWNHPSEKKALIIHGFESSVINFDRYVKPLVKKGYEVLAFDAPAHGRSSGKTINVLQYRDLLIRIMEDYGPIDSFIAHSFGGLAISLALERTKHDRSTRVVLIAPAVETKTAMENFFSFLGLDKEVRQEFEQVILQAGGHPPDWFSISRTAPYIHAEVLFLQDTQDQMTPLSDVQPIIEKNYPNFKFVISEGLGHRRIYRDNQSLKRIMDFL